MILTGKFPPQAEACDVPRCSEPAAVGLRTPTGWRDVCTHHALGMEVAFPAERATLAQHLSEKQSNPDSIFAGREYVMMENEDPNK
jgi:hypothetical protein